MQIFPNITFAFIAGGRIVKPWIQYLQQFTSAPPAVMPVSVGISPFSYEAAEPGQVSISGGTVSKINLIRGNVVIDVTGLKLIPVSISDTVQVFFGVAPTIQFLPSYGANTTS